MGGDGWSCGAHINVASEENNHENASSHTQAEQLLSAPDLESRVRTNDSTYPVRDVKYDEMYRDKYLRVSLWVNRLYRCGDCRENCL